MPENAFKLNVDQLIEDARRSDTLVDFGQVATPLGSGTPNFQATHLSNLGYFTQNSIGFDEADSFDLEQMELKRERYDMPYGVYGAARLAIKFGSNFDPSLDFSDLQPYQLIFSTASIRHRVDDLGLKEIRAASLSTVMKIETLDKIQRRKAAQAGSSDSAGLSVATRTIMQQIKQSRTRQISDGKNSLNEDKVIEYTKIAESKPLTSDTVSLFDIDSINFVFGLLREHLFVENHQNFS